MAKNHTREIPDPEINSKDLPVTENAGTVSDATR